MANNQPKTKYKRIELIESNNEESEEEEQTKHTEDDYGIMSGTDDENIDDNQHGNDLDVHQNSLFSDYDDDENVDHRYPNLYIYHRELYRLYQKNHQTIVDAVPFVERRSRYEIFKNQKVTT